MTQTMERSEARYGEMALVGPSGIGQGPLGREAQNGVSEMETRNRRQRPKRRKADPTKPCSSCSREIRASNTTGLCRECWLNPEVRPRGRFRKSEPADQIASAMTLMRRAAQGAGGEDPGMGLVPLLAAAAELEGLIVETVAANRAAGATWAQIGDELGIDRVVAFKRYNPAILAAQAQAS